MRTAYQKKDVRIFFLYVLSNNLTKRYSVLTAVKQAMRGLNSFIQRSIVLLFCLPNNLLRTTSFVEWPASFNTEEMYDIPNCISAGVLNGVSGVKISSTE